jgi:hypothetical protein
MEAKMDRIYFMVHKGKKILIEDFSSLKPGKEFLDTLVQAETTIAAQAEKSVLAVLDATNTTYNSEVLSAMKRFTQVNTPFIKASCVVGISGLLSVGLSAVSKASGRSFNTFNTREEALDYLADLK